MENIKQRTLAEFGVKDLLITRQNATTTAANLIINSGSFKEKSDHEIACRVIEMADKIVAYHWRGIQKP